MNKLENVKLANRIGTWYEIDRTDDYILFESEIYGDEAGWILTDSNLNEICETYDSIENTLADLDEPEWPSYDLEIGFDPYEGDYTFDC